MTTVDATGDVSRTEPAWRLPAELYALRPEAARLLDQVNEAAWEIAEPALLELIWLRVGRLIGTDDGTLSPAQVTRSRSLGLPEEKVSNLTSYSTAAEFSSADRECIAFAEQFAMDVSGVTPDMRDSLAAVVGPDKLHDFVTTVFVLEFTQRTQELSRRLLRSAAPVIARSPGNESDGDLSLQPALLEFQDAVVRGKALDPVTTELVRLRCARTHQCRICQTLRLADARTAGVDEEMTSKIDFYETSDLPEQHKVALRITDALILRPDTFSADLVDQARSHFDDEQLAELCLDIMKWSTQKIHVAMGTDGVDQAAKRQGRAALPTNEAGVSYFHFDDDGNFGFEEAGSGEASEAG